MHQSLQSILSEAKEIYRSWGTEQQPWFRGEPESKTPLVPKLFRKDWGRTEFQIVQEFRYMGPTYGSIHIPRENTNEWLFLMQHTGAPTRLLDWSAGLLPALFFALQEVSPILWMMDPNQLNKLAGWELPPNTLPITWANQDSPALRNIEAAFRNGDGAVKYPIGFIPTYIHPRMAAQRSRFTVHGSMQISIDTIDGLEHIHRFSISPQAKSEILTDLNLCGVSFSSLFPDYDGLGKEMSHPI